MGAINANDDFDDAKEPALQLAIKTKYVHCFWIHYGFYDVSNNIQGTSFLMYHFTWWTKNAPNVLSPQHSIILKTSARDDEIDLLLVKNSQCHLFICLSAHLFHTFNIP